MSRKKRSKNETREQRLKREFLRDTEELYRKLDENFEEASLFEISRALAEIGVKSTYDRRIYQLIDMSQKKDNVFDFEGHLKFLMEQWELELEARKRKLDWEDRMFLLRAAEYFAKRWTVKKLDELENAGRSTYYVKKQVKNLPSA